MTKRELRELLEEALVEWASEQRDARGDIFATAQDLENIKGDPLAFGSLLEGEDAYGLLRRVLAIQERREEAAQDAETAFERRGSFGGQPGLTFVTADGYRLRYEGGLWTDGDLEFNDTPSGWPVDAEGDTLPGHFEPF
ncbi:MAG TPA: hypothetical protein VNW90_19175 [Acetobacteraceae bacterium]|jgi:hypothetical protein|nr:hypothetical protein [Acetobacteraceae bacterium]